MMKLLPATILALSLHSLFAATTPAPCRLVTKEMPDHSIVITNCRGESVVEPPADTAAQAATTPSTTTPLPAEARKAQDEYEANYWKYNSESLALRHKVFRQQFYISGVIFLLVIALVGVGVYFAFVQFERGKAAGAAMDRTDLELGAGGLKISSSVLGLLVLALSMGFFFLYLKYVYPISVLTPDATAAKQQSK